VEEAIQRYKFREIGAAPGCRIPLYAITIARRIEHPAVALITRPHPPEPGTPASAPLRTGTETVAAKP
jgi:hypothetical protein